MFVEVSQQLLVLLLDLPVQFLLMSQDEIEPFLPIDASGTDWPRSSATSTRGGVIA